MLYEAFTPLFHHNDLAQQLFNIGKRYDLRAAEGLQYSPKAGQDYNVTIFCQSLDGINLPLVQRGEVGDAAKGVSVKLKRKVGGETDGYFKLNADGTLHVVGQTKMGFRVVRWPSIGSGMEVEKAMVVVEDLRRFGEYPFDGWE